MEGEQDSLSPEAFMAGILVYCPIRLPEKSSNKRTGILCFSIPVTVFRQSSTPRNQQKRNLLLWS